MKPLFDLRITQRRYLFKRSCRHALDLAGEQFSDFAGRRGILPGKLVGPQCFLTPAEFEILISEFHRV